MCIVWLLLTLVRYCCLCFWCYCRFHVRTQYDALQRRRGDKKSKSTAYYTHVCTHKINVYWFRIYIYVYICVYSESRNNYNERTMRKIEPKNTVCECRCERSQNSFKANSTLTTVHDDRGDDQQTYRFFFFFCQSCNPLLSPLRDQTVGRKMFWNR